MPFSIKELHLLIVEDNAGDFILIENYLKEEIENPVIYHTTSFENAKIFLTQNRQLDAILLDLSLPDANGDQLVNEMVKIQGQIPVIVLTGYIDRDYGINTLALGISDYLLKDELNASQLYRSIAYSIERKKIEIKLTDSERNYENLFHLSPLPMWVYDIDTLMFLRVNDAAIKHYGYSRSEFMDMTIRNIRPADEVQKMEERVKANARTNVNYKEAFRHQKKDGTEILVEIQTNQIKFEGKMAKLVLANDITEKIKSEQSLKLSQQRFKAMVQEGSSLIGILDLEGNQKYVSPNCEAMLGINVEQFMKQNIFDFIYEEDKERVMNQFQLLAHLKRLEITPFRLKVGIGKMRWIETILTNMMDDIAIGGIVANSRDVTSKIENDIKLKASVDRYNIVAKATSDIIWDCDLVKEEIIWNKGLQGIFGYRERDTVTSVEWWYSKIHPEDKGRITGTINSHLNHKNTRWQIEYRFQCNDGSYKYIFDRVFLVIDEEGKPVRMIGAMQDITRQKEEERRLKLLESVITNTNDAIVITEAESFDRQEPKIVFVNDAFTSMTGYSKEDVIGKTTAIFQGPETDLKELERLKNAMERWDACELEIINYKKNGEKFWIHIETTPVSDGKGWFSHWISIERDVSERMNYIQAIEEQNTRLKDIAWMQSHVVRAPLARIMGFVELLKDNPAQKIDDLDIASHLLSSATELDQIIRTIVKKTEQVENQATQ